MVVVEWGTRGEGIPFVEETHPLAQLQISKKPGNKSRVQISGQGREINQAAGVRRGGGGRGYRSTGHARQAEGKGVYLSYTGAYVSSSQKYSGVSRMSKCRLMLLRSMKISPIFLEMAVRDIPMLPVLANVAGIERFCSMTYKGRSTLRT